VTKSYLRIALGLAKQCHNDFRGSLFVAEPGSGYCRWSTKCLLAEVRPLGIMAGLNKRAQTETSASWIHNKKARDE